MAKMLLMEEFHVSVFAPRGLPEPKYLAIKQALDHRRFRTDLGRAIRQVFRRFSSLRAVQVKLSR